MNFNTWMEKQALSTAFVNKALLKSLENGFRHSGHLAQVGRILRKNMTREYQRALTRSLIKYPGDSKTKFYNSYSKLFGDDIPFKEVNTESGAYAFKNLERHFKNKKSVIGSEMLGDTTSKEYNSVARNLRPWEKRVPGARTKDVIDKIKWWQDTQGIQLNVKESLRNRNALIDYANSLMDKITKRTARLYPDAYDKFIHANNTNPSLISNVVKKYAPYSSQYYGDTKILTPDNYKQYIKDVNPLDDVTDIMRSSYAKHIQANPSKEIKSIISGEFPSSGFHPELNVIAMHPEQKSVSVALHENGHKHSVGRNRDYLQHTLTNRDFANTIKEELAASHGGASIIRPLQKTLNTKMPPPRSTYAGIPTYMLIGKQHAINTALMDADLPKIDFRTINSNLPLNWKSHGSIKDLYKYISPAQREQINKMYNTKIGTNADWFRELEKLENMYNRMGRQ